MENMGKTEDKLKLACVVVRWFGDTYMVPIRSASRSHAPLNIRGISTYVLVIDLSAGGSILNIIRYRYTFYCPTFNHTYVCVSVYKYINLLLHHLTRALSHNIYIIYITTYNFNYLANAYYTLQLIIKGTHNIVNARDLKPWRRRVSREYIH